MLFRNSHLFVEIGSITVFEAHKEFRLLKVPIRTSWFGKLCQPNLQSYSAPPRKTKASKSQRRLSIQWIHRGVNEEI